MGESSKRRPAGFDTSGFGQMANALNGARKELEQSGLDLIPDAELGWRSNLVKENLAHESEAGVFQFEEPVFEKALQQYLDSLKEKEGEPNSEQLKFIVEQFKRQREARRILDIQPLVAKKDAGDGKKYIECWSQKAMTQQKLKGKKSRLLCASIRFNITDETPQTLKGKYAIVWDGKKSSNVAQIDFDENDREEKASTLPAVKAPEKKVARAPDAPKLPAPDVRSAVVTPPSPDKKAVSPKGDDERRKEAEPPIQVGTLVLEHMLRCLEKGQPRTIKALRNVWERLNTEASLPSEQRTLHQKIEKRTYAQLQACTRSELSVDKESLLYVRAFHQDQRGGNDWVEKYKKDFEAYLGNPQEIVKALDELAGFNVRRLNEYDKKIRDAKTPSRERDLLRKMMRPLDNLEQTIQEVYNATDEESREFFEARVHYEAEQFVAQFLSGDEKKQYEKLCQETSEDKVRERKEKTQEYLKKYTQFALPGKRIYRSLNERVARQQAQEQILDVAHPKGQEHVMRRRVLFMKGVGIVDTKNPKPNSLDGATGLKLYEWCGFEHAQKPEFVVPGSVAERKHNINTGNKDGARMERRYNEQGRYFGIATFDDHHDDVSGRDTAAALVAWRRLDALGFQVTEKIKKDFDLDDASIERAKNLLVWEDNKSYPESNFDWENDSWRMVQGLAYAMTPEQVFKWAKRSKEPNAILTDEELESLGLKEASTEQKKKITSAKENIAKLKGQGLFVDTTKYGKVLISRTAVSGGSEAVRAILKQENANAYLVYPPFDDPSIALTMLQETPIQSDIEQRWGGKLVREKMFMFARNSQRSDVQRMDFQKFITEELGMESDDAAAVFAKWKTQGRKEVPSTTEREEISRKIEEKKRHLEELEQQLREQETQIAEIKQRILQEVTAKLVAELESNPATSKSVT